MKRFITCLCMLVLMTGCAAKAPISSPKVPMNTYKTTDVTFHTNKGDMTLAIETERVPNIAANFVNLAKAGKYDNTIFHRVIADFMIQGGDYENRNGTGGKAFVGGEIKDEFVSGLSNVRGAISMANRGPNTNGSQFFIVHKDAKFLDGKHSVFGRITSGMEVLDAIANTPKNMQDKPLEDVIIASVTVSE